MPWSVTHEGSHAYYTFAPDPPHDNASARAADDPDLRALMRVFMANRGVWESGWWLGPTVSVAHTENDVDRYRGLRRLSDGRDELTITRPSDGLGRRASSPTARA